MSNNTIMYVAFITLGVLNSQAEIAWPINIGGIILALWIGSRTKKDDQHDL